MAGGTAREVGRRTRAKEDGLNYPKHTYTAVTLEPFQILTRIYLHLICEYIFYTFISP